MSDNNYDVIIIGTGAGGGTVAAKLAQTNKRVLLIERGGYGPREKDNWSSKAVNLQGKYQTKEMWHDRNGEELHPHTNHCVGGNTKVLWRGAISFAARRFWRDPAPGRKFTGLANLIRLNWSAITRPRSGCTRYTAREAKTRPNRRLRPVPQPRRYP